MSNDTKFTKKISILTLSAHFLLVIIGAVGVVLIKSELNKMDHQNKTLEKTLRQSFRPIASLKEEDKHSGSNFKYTFKKPNKESPNKFSFYGEKKNKNIGNGIMLYIGSIYYISDELIDFRNKLLNSKLTNLNFDGKHPHTRGDAVFPQGTYITYINFTDLDFKNEYYIYIIYFYQDIDGNFYDTVFMNSLPVKANPTPNGLFPDIDYIKSKSYFKESYNVCSPKEVSKFCQLFKSHEHNLMYSFCDDYVE